MRKVNYKEKGITLIALVVTIIILLILAGVTLTTALSQNGLFQRAKIAGENYKKSEADEAEKLGEVEKEIDKIIDGETPPDQPDTPPTEDDTPLLSTVTSTEHEDNKKVQDSLGNPLVIPSGFKHKEGTNVEDGIVIEDKDGNEFVWIPVSNIDGNNDGKGTGLIKTKDKGDVEITLGRYTFKREINDSNEFIDGTPELVQKGSECDKDDEKFIIEKIYKENTTLDGTNGGVGAKSLEEFVTSVEKNHGYYLARYEAGKGTDGKPVSKEGDVWNYITQADASVATRKMYDGEKNYTSDLVNSYAWDTAIVYIQAMGNENYANAYDGNKILNRTGVKGDVKCNIYDMAKNVREWTTEFSTNTNNGSDSPCVRRGGDYNNSSNCTASRYSDSTTAKYPNIGFRPLLYLKS